VKQPTTYIMANLRNGTLYTGITSDLVNRVWQQLVVASAATQSTGAWIAASPSAPRNDG
jgi:predicted GIY-YIG superfamily endonuclease